MGGAPHVCYLKSNAKVDFLEELIEPLEMSERKFTVNLVLDFVRSIKQVQASHGYWTATLCYIYSTFCRGTVLIRIQRVFGCSDQYDEIIYPILR